MVYVLGLKGGGCGGVSMLIGFDKKKDTDLSYAIGDIPVYVDKKHTMYVIGKEVDFYEGEDTRGFMFVDPKDPYQQNQMNKNASAVDMPLQYACCTSCQVHHDLFL